jgi:hypothetical protein
MLGRIFLYICHFISDLSSQAHSLPLKGTPSTLEGEFLYSSSPNLGEVSRSDGGVCLSFISHLKCGIKGIYKQN